MNDNIRDMWQTLKQLKRRSEMTEIELLETIIEAEELIETIESSELRIMFRLYYIDDLTWVQTAHAMNNMFKNRVYTKDSCRMKNERFFKSLRKR
ncbi:MAG: hypothetical protein Q4B90_03970 [Eubacteriales bacterium]|nr:hypothetical protein [Eubacteriales bacterium]